VRFNFVKIVQRGRGLSSRIRRCSIFRRGGTFFFPVGVEGVQLNNSSYTKSTWAFPPIDDFLFDSQSSTYVLSIVTTTTNQPTNSQHKQHKKTLFTPRDISSFITFFLLDRVAILPSSHTTTMTTTMATSDLDFTIQLQDSRDVQMHFEVEKSGILQAVFDQYSKIEGLPREFNWLAIDIICVLM